MTTRIRRPVRAVARDVEVVDEAAVVDDVADAEVVDREIERAPWSPAQFVALIIGAIFTIIGGVALARGGFNFDDMASTHTTVGGMHHTAILGLIELVSGLILIGIGAVPGGARAGMTFIGTLVFGFGVVVMIASPSLTMHKWLGVHSGNGWFFTVAGVVLLATAMLSPVIFQTDRRAVGRRSAISAR